MELPSRVVVFCPILELKNKPARLIAISPHGYYEVRIDIGERNHTALLPIAGTGLVFQEANATGEPSMEIER
ncbi:MAG TPA: hypothetical protein VKS03_04190 [Thermoanaerobaculia bacterium]|nr:hypothetical protein [Thermoanaerobaculia bacterium]